MKRRTATPGILLLALAASPSLWAHHSVAHDFDVSREFRLQGTVTRMAWANPHIGLELQVSNADGSRSIWRVEGGPPNALLRRGWTRDSLQAGTVVSIRAWPARDGSQRANAHDITLPDGRVLDAASSYLAPRR